MKDKMKDKTKDNTKDKFNKKPRLVIASDTFLPRRDGISISLGEIITRMAKEFSITVLAPNLGHIEKKFPSVRILQQPLWLKITDFTISLPKLKMMKTEIQNCDIVFVHSFGPIGYFAVKYGKKYNKKIVSYIHSIDYELWPKNISMPAIPEKFMVKIIKRFLSKICNKNDLLLVPNMEVQEILRKLKVNTKIIIIPLGINTEKFYPPEDRNAIREKLKLDKNAFIIGYVGRLAAEKDLDTIITAFKQIEEKFPLARLVFVGEGLSKYKKLEDPKIIVTGQVDNVAEYLRAFDCFVLASLTETTSLATLEAMATGLPVICTPVGSIKKYIINGYNGLLFPKKNHYLLAKKFELLLNYEKLRTHLSENARKTVLQKYNWNETSNEIIEVLKKLIIS